MDKRAEIVLQWNDKGILKLLISVGDGPYYRRYFAEEPIIHELSRLMVRELDKIYGVANWCYPGRTDVPGEKG